MTNWVIKRQADLAAVPWRNGLGLTRDVMTVPGPTGELRWQVSIAELVQDAPFSHFPHCDRVFTPIAGDPPPELAFDGGGFEPCPLLVPRRFSGEVATRCRVAAPGRAFNAVFDRRRHTVEVTVLHLVADEPIALPDAQHLVLHCHEGGLLLGQARLDSGDSAVGRGRIAPVATVPGVAILVALHPA